MKKFSFLLIGAFLLGTITFALADENVNDNDSATTGATVEATTGDTVEAEDSNTVETTSVAETTTTGDTIEVATGDTVESTDADTVESTDADTVEATETTGDTAEVAETTTENEESTTPIISDSAKEKYNEEQIKAYEWAYENGITTINDADKARLSDGLTRAELAKMMSQYMTKVLGQTPVVTEEKVVYADVDESLGDLADFIQIAYAYKIMGINADGTPLKNFNPNGIVTRAEYATVFSRVLFGDKYNKSEGNYYEDHIKALKEVGILTNDTPTIQEVRGWVMLMMYRSTNAKTENTDEETTIGMPNPASVYCEEQGGTVNIVKDEDGNESGMCKLADGTEIDEWEYYRANNTGAVESLYTEEDLNAAKAVITETVNGWEVKVESFNAEYAGDETANNNLEYCQSLNSEVRECAVFTSSFHIPEQDEGVQMAGGFEPNTDMNGWTWYLGRTAGGNWTVLTNGLG